MIFFPSFKILISAYSTLTCTVRSYVSVLFRKLMTILTMRSSGKNSSSIFTSKNILFISDGFKMIRSHAIPVSTKVVYYKPFRNFSMRYLIRHSMSFNVFAFNLDSSISKRKTFFPKPTAPQMRLIFGERSFFVNFTGTVKIIHSAILYHAARRVNEYEVAL